MVPIFRKRFTGLKNVESKNLERDEDEEVVKRRTDKMKMLSRK